MTISVAAIYENGVLRPRQPLELAEGTEVRLTISAPADRAADAEVERALSARIDRLAALEPNWDGYGAPALDRHILFAAKQFIGWLATYTTAQPLAVPMSSGALQLEWHQGQKILQLEFEDPMTIHYLKWDPATGTEEEDVFPIGDTAKAASLIDWFTGVAANV
ncbi:MAG TPA: antitoxin family protein [Pirellulales bacterium]|nr:antitoxin family protein [Pirellulales bacterium]